MMEQPSLFSGEELKERGIEQVRLNNEDWHAAAVHMVSVLVRQNGSVTSDDLQAVMPPPPGIHPNIMGAVFAKAGLTCTGYVKSKRPSAHGRMIRQWK